MRNASLAPSLLLLLGPVVVLQAHAEIYMTDAQAAASIFPGLKMEPKTFELDAADSKKIEELSDQKVRSSQLKFFKAPTGEVVFIDQVLGKHEFITYAVGVRPDGKVAGIEVIEYRETYGQKIRDLQWRSQFVGKDKSSHLKLDDDIKNISGATLSSSHVTGGVKKILQTYELIRARI